MTKRTNARRRAIIRYKLTARAYRRRKVDYQKLEAARAVMCKALGYTWVYSYLGEFCNLHERDFPNMIRATQDRGRTFRYSGWESPVDAATHKDNMHKARARALELSRVFSLPLSERFLHGLHILYNPGNGRMYSAAWSPGDATTPAYITIFEHWEMFCKRIFHQSPCTEASARAFYNSLPRVNLHFQEVYTHGDDDLKFKPDRVLPERAPPPRLSTAA